MAVALRKLIVEFTKMSGAGNDFIVIDNRFYHFTRDELSALAQKWCKRRHGIGGDGLLAMAVPDSESTAFRMIYYNADGSLGTMCGNGARCLARFARDAGLVDEPLFFDSDAGVYSASIGERGQEVKLFVPGPKDFCQSQPLATASHHSIGGASYIWTGTEHLVVPVDSVDQVDLSVLGPLLRRDLQLGEAGANVNFVEQTGDDTFSVRTFEKGVEAETLACGTGSIATALVSHLNDLTKSRRISIHMKGGVLKVGWKGNALSPDQLYLEGPADIVYRGSFEM